MEQLAWQAGILVCINLARVVADDGLSEGKATCVFQFTAENY